MTVTISRFRIRLGQGRRRITEQGRGAVSDFIAHTPGGRRTITFDSCKMISGDLPASDDFTVYVHEQPSDANPNWPNDPWKIGVVWAEKLSVTLHLSPVAFQQLWDTAESPETERSVLGLEAQPDERGFFFVHEVDFEVHPQKHPMARYTDALISGVVKALIPLFWKALIPLFCMIGAVAVVEAGVRWLWH
jgi:hypothetical protein